MNNYILIPFIAFLLNGFTWTYVFAQENKDSVNFSYLMYAGFIQVWVGFAVILSLDLSNLNDIFKIIFLKVQNSSIIAVGFLFFNFVYVLFQKKRDFIYFFFFFSTIIFIFLTFSTDLVVKGYVKYYWGLNEKEGLLFVPVMVCCALFVICALYMVLQKIYDGSANYILKKQLEMVLAGSFITLIIAIYTGIILPPVFNNYDYARFTSISILVQAFFVFIATYRYKFLSIGIEKVANELFINLHDAVIILDKDGKIMQMNSPARELFNIQTSMLNELKISNFIDNYNYDKNYENHEVSIEKNGEKKYVILSQSPIKSANFELGKILIIKDITEKRKIEENLIKNEKRFKEIADELPEAIFESDIRGRVTYANETGQKKYGYTEEDIVEGVYIHQTIIPEDREKITKNAEKILKGELTGGVSYTALKKNGDIFPVIIHAKSIFNENKPVGLRGIIIDTTEQKIKEQEYKEAKEESERANKAKTSFLANMSHELRTPMNAIIGLSKSILRVGSENLTPKQKEGITLINKSGNKLLELINDILDLSKIESGKIDIDMQKISINELINNIEKTILPIIENKNIEFFIQKSISVPEIIVSDNKKLTQILLNLLGNAVKFTEEGEIILKIYTENSGLYFEVKDTGIGISREDTKYIFDEFVQRDEVLVKKYKGAGLGLALCKRYINLLGGEIEVTSEVNVGSTFKFYLPFKSEFQYLSEDFKKELMDLYEKSEENRYFFKILVVDDDEICRITLKMMLENDYDVVFASNGREALEKYFSERPDIVLMDIMMPEMDGYEAFTEIRKKRGNKYIPIIAVTAKAMKGDRDNIIYFGFDDYISKPIEDELLYSKLKRHLRKLN